MGTVETYQYLFPNCGGHFRMYNLFVEFNQIKEAGLFSISLPFYIFLKFRFNSIKTYQEEM